MELFESELRAPRPEEREVEAGAVERDDHGCLCDRGGELVEVDALDELPHPPAVVESDNGDVVAVPPQARRFDVEEDGLASPLPDRPPLVPRLEPPGEVPVVPGAEAGPRPLDLLVDGPRSLPPDSEPRAVLEEFVPRPEALAPEARLRRVPDPRRVDERAPEHSRSRLARFVRITVAAG